ncbi:MAG: hypothetical protein HYZ29_32360 [Myxococcales bacterium]|nr:hypothetical protein [Myxococcales bacterium]
MSSPTRDSNVDAILNRLELALCDERRALRTLDHDAVEDAARQKLDLAEQLTQAICESESAPDPARLQRVRSALVHNQLLLVHARDAVRGVLGILTGAAGATYGPHGARHLGASGGLDTTG